MAAAARRRPPTLECQVAPGRRRRRYDGGDTTVATRKGRGGQVRSSEVTDVPVWYHTIGVQTDVEITRGSKTPRFIAQLELPSGSFDPLCFLRY